MESAQGPGVPVIGNAALRDVRIQPTLGKFTLAERAGKKPALVLF
jgi:hypothetical protein